MGQWLTLTGRYFEVKIKDKRNTLLLLAQAPVVALLLAIPSTIPLLGWGNWFVLPIAVVGIGLGALSSSNSGRNFCLIVFAIAVVRLMLGGGII